MFYAQFVLAKKGPLAKIWLAAHWEKKLTKAQIYETDVPQAIEEVIRPKVKMALRTVGHLLLGIVRIYSKKTRYLLADTNEAYLKMKVNFRDGFTFEADLPLDPEIDENFENAIDEFNITVPEFLEEDYNQKLIMANVSRLEDITLKDDCNFNAHFRVHNGADDGFGDEDYVQIENIYGSLEPLSMRPTPQPESLIEQERARDGTIDPSISSRPAGESILLSDGSGYQGVPFSPVLGGPVNLKIENQTMEPLDLGPHDMFSSMIQPSGAGDAQIPAQDEPMDIEYHDENTMVAPEEVRAPTPESFALEPLDMDNIEGNKKKRQRKPRKLMVDAETMISNEAFREQQENYEETLQTVAVAPPSRKMLNLCVSGDLAHLMSMPGQAIYNRELLKAYKSCLVARQFDPNFTIMELSDSSSCASVDRPSAPWEDLELNEHINDDQIEPGPMQDDFFDDLAHLDQDFAPEPAQHLDYTLRINEDVSMGGVQAQEPIPEPALNEENKENEEDDWSDPFGSSVSSQRGRLEAYGFGNSTIRKHVDDEGKWTKRANHILKKVTADIEANGRADFSTVTSSAKNRKQAAEQFYSLLTLVKSQIVDVEQEEPYGEIIIRPGDNFSKNSGVPEAGQESVARTPMKLI